MIYDKGRPANTHTIPKEMRQDPEHDCLDQLKDALAEAEDFCVDFAMEQRREAERSKQKAKQLTKEIEHLAAKRALRDNDHELPV